MDPLNYEIQLLQRQKEEEFSSIRTIPSLQPSPQVSIRSEWRMISTCRERLSLSRSAF